MRLVLALRHQHTQAGRRRLEAMALGTKQHAERAARLRRELQAPQPAIIGSLAATAAPPRTLPNSRPARRPTRLRWRWQGAPPISGRVRCPAAPGPAHKVHAAEQSKPAREPHSALRWHSTKAGKNSCISPRPVAPATLRRATPSANHRPASAHRARSDRWTKPDERRGGLAEASFNFQTRASAKISASG